MLPLFAALVASTAFAGDAPPPTIRGIGEVWGGVTLPMDAAGSPPELELRRLAAGAELDNGHGLSARLLLDGAQVTSAETPQLVVHDAWAGLKTEGATGVSGRIGVARPTFGVMERFEDSRRYWVAGDSAELERVAGFQPDSAVAATFTGFGRRWSAAAELGDAAPVSATGVNFAAVEARGRGEVRFGDEAFAVHTGASVAYRLPGVIEGGTRLVGEAHVELVAPRFAALFSGVGGTEGSVGMPLAGAMVTLATPIPVGGDAVKQVSFVFGGLVWDPTITGLPDEQDVPDAALRGRAGFNVDWAVGDRSLITGVGFTIHSPQDLAKPITESLTVEAAWRF